MNFLSGNKLGRVMKLQQKKTRNIYLFKTNKNIKTIYLFVS